MSVSGVLQTAVQACVPGGKVVLVGMGQNDMKLPMASASCKEIDLCGSFRYANTVRQVHTGRPGLSRSVTWRGGGGGQGMGPLYIGSEGSTRSDDCKD